MKWKFCSKTIYEYCIKMNCTFFLIFERKNSEKHLCFIENFTDYFAFILSALKYYFLNQCIYTVGEIIICAPKLRNNFWCTIKLLDFLLVALNLFDFFFLNWFMASFLYCSLIVITLSTIAIMIVVSLFMLFAKSFFVLRARKSNNYIETRKEAKNLLKN